MVFDRRGYRQWRAAREVWGRSLTRPTAALERAAQTLLAELSTLHPLPQPPALLWKPFRTTAGRADYQTWSIHLGAVVLDTEEKLRSTLIHEYAHLLAFARAGRKGWGHGPAWRQAMQDLGQSPEVYHRYPVQRNKPRQAVRYRCERCGTTFMRLRLLPRKKRFMHAGCGGRIEFVVRVALTDPDITA